MHQTLYISGPISSDPRPLDLKMKRFADAADRLIDAGFSVINPFLVPPACDSDPCAYGEPEPGAQDNVHSWRCFLRADLASMLITCHGVATLDGWENSKGALLETSTATAVGMTIAPLGTWLGLCARCGQGEKYHAPGQSRSGCDYAGVGTASACRDCGFTVVWDGEAWRDGTNSNTNLSKYCAASKDSNPLHRPIDAGDLRS